MRNKNKRCRRQPQKLQFLQQQSVVIKRKNLETFSVNNRWARFIVFLFADPHLLEGRQGSKNGTTNPDGIFSFWWSDNFNLHCARSQRSDFLLHSIGNSRIHGGSTREDGVGIKIFSNINIALHDGICKITNFIV